MSKLADTLNKLQKLLIDRHLNRILFPLFPVLVFVISQMSIGSEGLKDIEIQLLILNILIFEALGYIFLAICNRMSIAVFIEALITELFAVANSFVRMFRGSYIMPWDFMSMRTAANVAGNYSYVMDINAKRGIIAMVIVCILGFVLFDLKKADLSGIKRLVLIAVSSVFIFALGISVSNDTVAERLRLHDSMFSVTRSYTSNGMLLGFLYKLQKVFVEKPEGYSKLDEKSILDGIDVSEETREAKDMPDIIVVMNEAFSDLKVDAPFNTNKDYMPFLHSLEGKENTVTGHAHVSVLGGQTPNSEFEVLTGNTLTFLPENSIPFQTFVRRRMDAIPWYLQSLGYFNLAMHPYHSSGWDRTIAWPYLGFQECRFYTDFNSYDPDLKLIREYISDEAMYDVLLDKMSKRDDKNQPMFTFNVTMQNHSSYKKTFDNLPQEITVDGVEDMEDDNSRSLINYLNLIYESDRAFEKLIKELENADRDTIVLFYGDHQPDPEVVEPIYTMNGIDTNNLSAQNVINDHVVPFVIWANYDIEEGEDIDISLNYLGNLLLKEAGIPLTRYRSYIDSFSDEYPVVSAIGGLRKDGSIISLQELKEELTDLEAMQYYEMFEDSDEYY